MRLASNIFLRGRTFCFRVSVPKDVHAKIGRKELWRSLRTRDVLIANRRGSVALILTRQLWRDLQCAMTIEEIKALIAAWTSACLKADEDARRTLSADDLAAHEATQSETFGGAVVRRLDAVFDPSVAERHVDDLVEQGKLQLEPKEREIAIRLMMNAHVEVFRATAARKGARWRPWLDDDPAEDIVGRNRPSLSAPIAQSSQSPMDPAFGKLGAVARDAIRDLGQKNEWRPKRIADYEAAVATLIFALGYDPDLGEVSADMAGTFMRRLSKYPSNVSKRLPYRDLTTFQARLDEVERSGDRNVLNPTTINNKYLTPLRQIWEWRRVERRQLTNPFSGVRADLPRKADPRKTRRDFSFTEIQRLLALPLFTGSAELSGPGLYQPGAVRVDDWRFWVPLICLFSGMRLNEACGLAVSDIKHADEVDFFHVRDEVEGQSLKTIASRRKVPIHSVLIDVGFLDFVEEQRKRGSQRLFMDLREDALGYFSGPPSKFFNRLIERIVDEEPDKPGKLVFHSTRHTVTTRLRAANVRIDFAKEIIGHEQGDTHGGYGGFPLEAIRDSVNLISYPGITFAAVKRESGTQ